MIINLTESYKLIHDATNAFNDSKPSKEKLKTPQVTLMRMLVSLYGKQMNKMVRTSINYGALPMLYTNNVQLSQLLHCSERSILNYIKRLTAANFIQDKIFHGSNSSYELRLNPTLFLVPEGCIHETPTPQKNAASWVSSSTLRHTDSGYINNSIKDVDSAKSISLETSGDQIPATRGAEASALDHPEENVAAERYGAASAVQLPGGAGALVSEVVYEKDLAPASLATLTMMIQNLWNFLFIKWYAGKFKFISDAQLNHVWNYFYAQFISLPESEWNNLWREHLIRIMQVANYQEKNSTRYVPLPSVMFAGKQLYNKTRQWFLKSKQRQVDFDKWKEDYELAIHESKVFKEVMRKYLKTPTVFEFRKAEQRLSKHSTPALQEFYKVVLTAHA
jgi:hypothetical protein